jgi:cell division septation protein DedD
MADESLHEVQLHGKQLVFLFMVGTVIAVVIFLCGVLVGRGLRPAGNGLELARTDSASTIDPTQSLPPASTAQAPSDGMPVSASESLTYGERLASPTSSPEDLREAAKPVAEPTIAAPAAPRSREAVKPPVTSRGRGPAPAAAAAPAVPAPPVAPAGKGFAVQVMAVNTRTEADAVAKRLAAKGYSAFVTPGPGPKLSYRVRVGMFGTKREAEAMSARLQKEEQFNPWVTQ